MKIKINKKMVDLKDIENLTERSAGFYTCLYKNGKTEEFCISAKIAKEAITKIRSQDNEVAMSDTDTDTTKKKSAKIGEENVNDKIRRIEKSFGGFLDVTYKNPDFFGYWEADTGINKRLQLGYVFSKKEDILDFNTQFADINLGLEPNPDGLIKRGGLTLMHTSREIRDAILNYNYNNRPRVEAVGGYKEK